MGLKQPELGDRQRFEVRRGVGGFSQWGGINRNTDLSGVDPWDFHTLINVSFDRGITSRGGQEKLDADTAMSACVAGIIDLGSPDNTPATSLFWAAANLLGGGGGSGVLNDELATPQAGFTQTGNVVAWTRRYSFARFDGQLYFFKVDVDSRNVLYRLEALTTQGVAAAATAVTILPFPMCSAVEHQGKLYISGDGGGVCSWDGTTIAIELVDSVPGYGTILGSVDGVLYYFGPQSMKRLVGTTWESGSGPSGVTTFVPLCSPVTYGGVTYIGGRDKRSPASLLPTICTVSGLSMSVVFQSPNIDLSQGAGSAGNDKWGVFGLQVFGGYLYYAYGTRQAGHGDEGRLGRTSDGSLFADVPGFGSAISGVHSLSGIGEYRGRLCIGVVMDPATDDPPPVGIGRSIGTDTSQAFTFESSGSVGAAEFVVF